MKSGIPTLYDGVRFRSRLEARWAAFFDAIGWRWAYEPYDRDGWIPDFLILGAAPLLAEVKPAANVAELARLVEPAHVYPERMLGGDGWNDDGYGWQNLAARGIPEVLLVGASPRLQGSESYVVNGEELKGWGASDVDGGGFAGFLGDGQWFDGSAGTFGEAAWCRCCACGQVGVWHIVHSFASRPCGHHEGDHHLGEWTEAETRTAWASASNRTQWKPSRASHEETGEKH